MPPVSGVRLCASRRSPLVQHLVSLGAQILGTRPGFSPCLLHCRFWRTQSAVWMRERSGCLAFRYKCVRRVMPHGLLPPVPSHPFPKNHLLCVNADLSSEPRRHGVDAAGGVCRRDRSRHRTHAGGARPRAPTFHLQTTLFRADFTILWRQADDRLLTICHELGCCCGTHGATSTPCRVLLPWLLPAGSSHLPARAQQERLR